MQREEAGRAANEAEPQEGDVRPARSTGHEDLARALEALSNPVRIGLLHRLGTPSFMPDLATEFGMTRQALKKHLDELEEMGLVLARQSRRGVLRATEYCANPAGLFALKESILSLAVTTDPASLPPAATLPSVARKPSTLASGPGLLLVHGDTPGRWFGLGGKVSFILGRDAKADVSLAYDAFASARHAMLRKGPSGWTLTDLRSTNGTRVNFQPVPTGETVGIAHGDLLTVGKSHLLIRDGI
jgi:DNA-binding transcriptional ArsR family regulator